MPWVHLNSPVPKGASANCCPIDWPDGARVVPLDPPKNFPYKSFDSVALSRRTARDFGVVGMGQLSSLFWLSHRVQHVHSSNLGFHLSQRPVISAGAIHPITILTALYPEETWWRYDPERHQLCSLDLSDSLASVRKEIECVVDAQHGAILLFVAQPDMAAAKYEHPESLVWRDAGALLAQLSLAAHALDLNFCPLGITGQNYAEQLDNQGKLIGVGMAIVGSR